MNRTHKDLLDVNHASTPPAEEACPLRFQLTPATHPQSLSQILGDIQTSSPSALLLSPHPNTSSALVFLFLCTQGGGH
jgi:hypothetical protein